MGLINNFQFVGQKNMGGGAVFNYPAALSVIAPYLVSCKARVPAVPAARYCKRSFGFSRCLLIAPIKFFVGAGSEKLSYYSVPIKTHS